jgi:hypothetical protein
MYGLWIDPSGKIYIPVQDVKTLVNGVKVYMIQGGQFVKMVTSTGEARYFTGTIAEFNPNLWSSYNNAGDGYKYKAPIPIKVVTPKRTLTYNKDGLINTGLQCYLDATRKQSATGQVWKDISGKGRDFKWNKSPLLFNGKYSTFGNVAVGPNGDTFGLGDGSNGFAIVLYSKTNSLKQGEAFLVENKYSIHGLNAHIPWIDNIVYFDQGWSKNDANIQTNRISKLVGPCSSFSVWAFVRDIDGSMKIYKDGTLLVSNPSNSADPLDLKASPWKTALNMDMDISKFMVYNTYLTASDVANVTKWIIADEKKQKIDRMIESSKLVPDSVPVKLGLQLFLDTSNYTIGSTEWKDQSGNGYDFTWNTPPKVVGKSFLLNGEYALSNKGSKLINIDDNDTYTICWTSKTNTLGQNNVFKLKGNHSHSRGIFCHPTWTDNVMYFDQTGWTDPNMQRVYTSVAKYSNKHTTYAIRRTSKERAIFINGVKAASMPNGGNPLNINLDKMIIARDLEDNFTWFANLKKFMVYNRDLSDDEIQTLYMNNPKRIMTYNNDGLITTGLQCYLDATRKESTQGQTWKDISGNGRDFKWNKSPLLFNGKYCTKGNVAIGPNGDSFGLDDGSKGYSIILYSKTNSLTQGHAFLVSDNSSDYGLNAHIPWTDSTVYFDQGWSKNASNIANNRIQKGVGPCSSFSVWAFVRDSDSSMKIYKDGNLLVSNSANSADAFDLKASPWQIAVNMDADISKFMVYNTYFTASDVANVTKWIFADEIKQKSLRMAEGSKLVPDSIPVTLGLQLFLDTSNYTIGSKEWKDQSGNGYDFTWNKAPVIQNKSFLINGEYALSNKGSKLINIDDKDTYTICWTAKTNSLGYNNVFKIKGNHLDNRGIFCHPTWTDNNMYFDQAGCCDPNKQRVYTSVAKYSNKYTFYTIRKTSKERAIFINGVKAVSIPTGGDPLNINLDKMIIGRDLEYNYTWNANIKNFMVYNRDLSINEINSLYSKFFSNYNFLKGGHKAAELFCEKQGKKLCKLDDYCLEGKPINSLEEVDKWGPINDYPDGWVQLGKNGDVCTTLKQKCQTSNSGICSGKFDDKEIAVLCCDSKYVPLVINAILVGTDNTYTFFKSKKYQTISPNNTSKVNDIKDFKGLTSKFVGGDIDAISISNKPNVSIWLKGRYVMIYDNIQHTGEERTINTYFHNLPNDFNDGELDAIATRGPSTEYILFKKTRYCIIDMSSNKFISAGNIKDKYTNLPSDFKMGFIDCAVYSRQNCSYLMKNDKLVEYNFSTNSIMKGPINIIDVWTTLLPPFLPKNKVCSVYEKLMKSDTNKQYWETKYYKECKHITKKEYDTNLNNYKLLVDRYKNEYMKEEDDRKKMEIEITKYKKLLNDKKKEMTADEEKLTRIKAIPCKDDATCSDKSVQKKICKTKSNINSGKKQIIVYEKSSIFEPLKFYQVNSQEINTCMPYDMNKYIKKSLVPKQKIAADFNIQNHPDYKNYTLLN